MVDYTRDQLMQALRDADAAGDEASARVIAGRIQSLGSTPSQPVKETPTKDVTGGAYTYDKGDGWASVLHNFAVKLNNATRVASDATTYGGLDAAQSLLPGSPSAKDLRAQTNASREDLGPYTAAAVDAAGRAANPLSWMGGTGPLGLAISGAGQQALSAALHGEDAKNVAEATVAGGLTGGTIGTAGKYLATPSFLSNVVKHYGPMVTTGALTHLGAGPIAGTMAGLASHGIWPSLQKVVPYADPWWNTPINAGVQGVLSGLPQHQ